METLVFIYNEVFDYNQYFEMLSNFFSVSWGYKHYTVMFIFASAVVAAISILCSIINFRNPLKILFLIIRILNFAALVPLISNITNFDLLFPEMLLIIPLIGFSFAMEWRSVDPLVKLKTNISKLIFNIITIIFSLIYIFIVMMCVHILIKFL